MRELKTNDVFRMSRILKRMNLKDKVEATTQVVIDGETKIKTKAQEQFGVEFFIVIGENLYMAQKEINEFLGDLVGLTGDEFGELPFSKSFKYIEEFKNLPGIDNFFKQASQLMKQTS